MPATNAIKEFRRHPEYFIDDGNFHILVKDTHFCVHSYFFTRESQTFQKHFNDHKGTESNAVVIEEDITAEQFTTFLWVFYDSKYSRIATEENWIVILDLANLWGFSEVKALAVEKLESIDILPVKRISLYQKYNVPEEILSPHYACLCGRTQILTLEETETLGGATTIMIFAIRERLLITQNGKPLEQIDDKIIHRLVHSYIESRKKKSTQGKNDANNKNITVNGNNK